MNNTSMLPVGTILRGIYRIDKQLASGGFGNTYVATNIEFSETVAIKEFFMKGVTERDETTNIISVSNSENEHQFEEQREKFKKEARRLRKLKSNHIVKVHDLFEENGTAYYVMDYVDGESLAERMKRIGTALSEELVRKILLQILNALKEVHQNEIWHLDLKPGNIMLDKSGNAYLIDFGASKQIQANGSMTTSTAFCYTPGYAPNEQIEQMYERFGPWTDIYALGATLYNLLTKKKPPMAIDIEEDEEEAFAFPADVSNDMKDLIVWMMQPKRKERPQNVEEIAKRFHSEAEKEIIANMGTTILPSSDVSKEIIHHEETIISSHPPYNSEETMFFGNYHQSNLKVQAVDLGLSVLWADCNVGESPGNPTGGLYCWGDATGKKTSFDVADYVPLRRFLSHQIEGDMGYSEVDVATQQWGKRWRTPNRDQWMELIQKCQWYQLKHHNIWGYQVTGPNDNSIFLPVTGIRWGEKTSNIYCGYYWTSELTDNDMARAYYFFFDMEMRNMHANTQNYVYSGRAIRPVAEK